MNYNQPPQQSLPERANPIGEVFLRGDTPLVINKPVFNPDEVRQMTGIIGHEYLGSAIIPTHIDVQHTETKTFHIFRAAAEIAMPITEGGVASPAHQLGNMMISCPRRAVTLVEGEALQNLMSLNGQNVAKRSERQAGVEADERRYIDRDYTRRLRTGDSCIVGRQATFAPIIGSEAKGTSRQHFSVTATETGVIVQNMSSNGTLVRMAQ